MSPERWNAKVLAALGLAATACTTGEVLRPCLSVVEEDAELDGAPPSEDEAGDEPVMTPCLEAMPADPCLTTLPVADPVEKDDEVRLHPCLRVASCEGRVERYIDELAEPRVTPRMLLTREHLRKNLPPMVLECLEKEAAAMKTRTDGSSDGTHEGDGSGAPHDPTQETP